MSAGNFHIKIKNGISENYLITEEKTDQKLLLLPFEVNHHLFNLKDIRKNTYKLPENHLFNLIKTEEIQPTESNVSIGKIKCRITKEEYIATVEKIKGHIHRGDIYETNFCFEFYTENSTVDPFSIFNRLNKKAKAPFSSLTKIDDLYLLCASPERFLKKTGDKIVSEPMKGTSPRNADSKIDEENKNNLGKSLKEQNENVMIVDLVRNDLSRIAKRGSVKVEELFGIKSFATVHQMVSVISCENNNHSIEEILNATFPMGSMTGVPKKRMLELTAQYEKKPRGIYSGTIGMIEPNGNFDLSVIIRSIVYDAKNKYLSFSVGSAITAGCNPEDEYEECLLKAKTMTDVLIN